MKVDAQLVPEKNLVGCAGWGTVFEVELSRDDADLSTQELVSSSGTPRCRLAEFSVPLCGPMRVGTRAVRKKRKGTTQTCKRLYPAIAPQVPKVPFGHLALVVVSFISMFSGNRYLISIGVWRLAWGS